VAGTAPWQVQQWQIWESEEVDEYIEPEYIEDTGNQEGTEEREDEQVWIDREVIIKEQERQAET
jgi:hypothetical protein